MPAKNAAPPRCRPRAAWLEALPLAAAVTAPTGAAASIASPLQDIVLLRGCFARINHPFIPPTCIAHPGAIRLHDYWAVYDFPSGLPFVCYTPYNIGDGNIV